MDINWSKFRIVASLIAKMTPSLQSNVACLEGVVRPIRFGNATNWTILTRIRCLKKCVSARGASVPGVPGTCPIGPMVNPPLGTIWQEDNARQANLEVASVVRPLPNHGTLRLPNDDDDDENHHDSSWFSGLVFSSHLGLALTFLHLASF